MINYRCQLEPGHYYHVYNRGIDSEKIFFTEKNYSFFLKRYSDNVCPYVETLAWCLIPNHFHFVIRVKENTNPTDVSRAYQKLFTGYAKAINKDTQRHGSLFEKPFKRIEISSDLYLRSVIVYVNTNSVHHGYTIKPEEWQHSSYNSIINSQFSDLNSKETLELFDDKNNFIQCHKFRAELELELALE